MRVNNVKNMENAEHIFHLAFSEQKIYLHAQEEYKSNE